MSHRSNTEEAAPSCEGLAPVLSQPTQCLEQALGSLSTWLTQQQQAVEALASHHGVMDRSRHKTDLTGAACDRGINE
ncbi:MAG: hypothetical protein NTX84_03760 [Nitrospirae bacterium]|nr:hypothetical protein [Nitrospirota bacterium]